MVWGGGGAGERLYTYPATPAVTTRTTPALCAAMKKSRLNVSLIAGEGQNHKTVSTDHNL